MMLEVTRSNRAFPHTFLDWRAKVKTSLARAADVDDDFRVSRHINTSHSRLFGIRVGWSIVSTPKNSSTHERERLRMKRIRGAEAAETRRNAADVDGSTPCVAMILLSWSGMRTSSLLSCVYHPGYNATTVAELSSSVYAERNPADRKVKRAYAHERFMTARIDDIPR